MNEWSYIAAHVPKPNPNVYRPFDHIELKESKPYKRKNNLFEHHKTSIIMQMDIGFRLMVCIPYKIYWLQEQPFSSHLDYCWTNNISVQWYFTSICIDSILNIFGRKLLQNILKWTQFIQECLLYSFCSFFMIQSLLLHYYLYFYNDAIRKTLKNKQCAGKNIKYDDRMKVFLLLRNIVCVCVWRKVYKKEL